MLPPPLSILFFINSERGFQNRSGELSGVLCVGCRSPAAPVMSLSTLLADRDETIKEPMSIQSNIVEVGARPVAK